MNERRLKAKTEALTHYSGGTIACANKFGQHDKPYIDIRALTLDYINGGHGRSGMPRGRQLYRKLKKQGWPPFWQVLCCNCQSIKVFENEEQPRIYKRKPQLLKLPFRTTRHRWQTRESTLREAARADEKEKTSENRSFFEKVKLQCNSFAENRTLKPGQSVRVNRGIFGILDIVISRLTREDVLSGIHRLSGEPIPRGHNYVVSMTSEVRGVIERDIVTTGSTAKGAMSDALQKLEDDLCSGT